MLDRNTLLMYCIIIYVNLLYYYNYILIVVFNSYTIKYVKIDSIINNKQVTTQVNLFYICNKFQTSSVLFKYLERIRTYPIESICFLYSNPIKHITINFVTQKIKIDNVSFSIILNDISLSYINQCISEM